MKEIINILVESQRVLNEMKKNDDQGIEKIKENHKNLEKCLSDKENHTVYQKYIDIHNIILKSAKEYLNTDNDIYKLQPLFFYYDPSNYNIEDNTLELSLGENKVIFDVDKRNIQVHDEFYIENDSIFEKANIPLMIRNTIAYKDVASLEKLETYIENLINYANSII
ncbi:hypothetical protein NSA47_02690 [Irregularibacter muris]|uniref:Uncharacterized protein n=1 Tax=Irregularibacter muris TaxID=1796619 RepID=A0AAE3HEB2_9FIRM|nr:hypothetical protein [Irregularibacter muris]MCR1897894.1 hypothetical protein [Irregularibacter muris]